jgi:hypothetical protein
MNLGANFPFMPNLSMCFHGATFMEAYFFCLSWVAFIRSLIILTFSVMICTNSALYSFLSPTSSQHKGVLHFLS